ncbi:Polyketide cyclase / dehydrase and lipid transport [bacterium YEK0313]|nr:Polyketide cyclase / dehydrase and lipid transport [bacterium YEK0313]
MSTTDLILLILALLVAAVLAYAATRPADFRIARSTTIAAPPETIYRLIEDFSRWVAWSPYEGRDPDMKRSRSGAPTGVGAVYAWQGDRRVGQGRMEIVEAEPPTRLVIQLDFIKPFEARNTAEFTLEPAGNGTKVTWAMTGKSPFMMRLMGLFMNMDRMIGKDFEAGLASMKSAAEA